jgi:hypothetical protein
MWIFEQHSGRLYQDTDLETFYQGYSGHADGKNNPAMQGVKNFGPIPVGLYDIGEPHDTETHGPYVLRLTPAPENEMHGRDNFLIHGDSRTLPGTASHGCIVISRPARMAVWLSEDRPLKVIAGG